MGPVGEADRELGALLDEEDGDAASADLGERLEDPVHDRRGEPERGLVEEEQVGPSDERPRDGELLLLPAREDSGRSVTRVVHDGEERRDAVEVV